MTKKHYEYTINFPREKRTQQIDSRNSKQAHPSKTQKQNKQANQTYITYSVQGHISSVGFALD